MSSAMRPFMVSKRSIDLAVTGLVRHCRIWIVLAVNSFTLTICSGKLLWTNRRATHIVSIEAALAAFCPN
jgi:hypothetical protein